MNPESPSQPPASELMRPESLVECPNCKAKNPFKKMGVERPSNLEAGLVEGLLICPDCGYETHCYWLPKELRVQQQEIFQKIAVLAKRKTPMNFRRVKELKEKYKNLFDIAQSKYQAIMNVKKILESDDGRTA